MRSVEGKKTRMNVHAEMKEKERTMKDEDGQSDVETSKLGLWNRTTRRKKREKTILIQGRKTISMRAVSQRTLAALE